MFDPFDEPEDRFGLNDDSLGKDVLLGLIPGFGILWTLGSMIFLIDKYPDNPYNMCNSIWNGSLVSFVAHVMYLALLVVL